MKRAANGFTLVELMVAVAILGILTAIALPSYTSYVTRARLTEAFSALSGVQPNLEQYWSNNRTFAGYAALPTSTNFAYALTAADASSYTVTATGTGTVDQFVFTINQSGVRATTGAPAGWTLNASCWIDRKSGQCVQ